jgi:hypothetical protein
MKARNLISISRRVRNKVIVPGRIMFGAGDPTFHIVPEIVDWGANRSVFWLGMELVILDCARLPSLAWRRMSPGALLLLGCLHFCLIGSSVKSNTNPVSQGAR